MPKRFPRYPKGADVGTTLRKIWKKTKFKVVQRDGLTKFIFYLNFNIPTRIKNKEQSVYLQLFSAGRSSFESMLRQAWRESLYGQERVRDLTDRLLYTIVREALSGLYSEANSIPPYARYLGDGAVGVRNASKRTRRPSIHKLKSLSRRIAKRYSELLPEIRQFRNTLRTHPLLKDEALLKESLRQASGASWIHHVVAGDALRRLPDIPAHKSTATLGGLGWTPRQLAIGVVWCEQKESDPNFSVQPNTLLSEYITRGNKLNRNSSR